MGIDNGNVWCRSKVGEVCVGESKLHRRPIDDAVSREEGGRHSRMYVEQPESRE